MYYFAFSPAVAMEIGPADYRVNLILKLRRVWTRQHNVYHWLWFMMDGIANTGYIVLCKAHVVSTRVATRSPSQPWCLVYRLFLLWCFFIACSSTEWEYDAEASCIVFSVCLSVCLPTILFPRWRPPIRFPVGRSYDPPYVRRPNIIWTFQLKSCT